MFNIASARFAARRTRFQVQGFGSLARTHVNDSVSSLDRNAEATADVEQWKTKTIIF
jgi:hypothetical protein